MLFYQVGKNSGQLAEIYAKISRLPDGDHGSLPFVLLSKLDLERWLALPPADKDVSTLIGLIVAALRKTGHDPPPSRQMIHGLHRKQLFQIFRLHFPAYYSPILVAMLSLSANNQVDPELWFDLLNALLGQPGAVRSAQKSQARDSESHLLETFARNHPADVSILEIVSQLAGHFTRERRQFGLYGLYPKYRAYVRPLAVYFNLLSLQLSYAHCDSCTLSPERIEPIWRQLLSLYEPWLLPLKPGARPTTANWIQQLTEETTSLLPW